MRGHQLRSNGHRPVVPVVPAQGEAEAIFDELAAVGTEGAGDRHVRGHFAKAGHQEVHHHADQGVRQQRATRAGGGDGGAGGDEQPRADGAADGDHVQVAGRKRPLQARFFCIHLRTSWLSHTGPGANGIPLLWLIIADLFIGFIVIPPRVSLGRMHARRWALWPVLDRSCS
ncbi:hypothetical protein D3C81_1553440 [compost metagenome]